MWRRQQWRWLWRWRRQCCWWWRYWKQLHQLLLLLPLPLVLRLPLVPSGVGVLVMPLLLLRHACPGPAVIWGGVAAGRPSPTACSPALALPFGLPVGCGLLPTPRRPGRLEECPSRAVCSALRGDRRPHWSRTARESGRAEPNAIAADDVRASLGLHVPLHGRHARGEAHGGPGVLRQWPHSQAAPTLRNAHEQHELVLRPPVHAAPGRQLRQQLPGHLRPHVRARHPRLPIPQPTRPEPAAGGGLGHDGDAGGNVRAAVPGDHVPVHRHVLHLRVLLPQNAGAGVHQQPKVVGLVVPHGEGLDGEPGNGPGVQAANPGKGPAKGPPDRDLDLAPPPRVEAPPPQVDANRHPKPVLQQRRKHEAQLVKGRGHRNVRAALEHERARARGEQHAGQRDLNQQRDAAGGCGVGREGTPEELTRSERHLRRPDLVALQTTGTHLTDDPEAREMLRPQPWGLPSGPDVVQDDWLAHERGTHDGIADNLPPTDVAVDEQDLFHHLKK